MTKLFNRYHSVTYYFIAVALSIFVTVLKLYFAEVGEATPFLLYIFIVMVSAYLGGIGPGLVALVITVLLSDFYFIPPNNSLNILSGIKRIQLLAYIAEGCIAILFLGALRNTRSELTNINEKLEQRVTKRTEKLRRTTEELQNINAELTRSNRELEDFAYVASHDLQEPLRKVQSFGNLLNEEYKKNLEGEGIMYLDRILNAAGRMRSLIEDLLSYSRVTTRQKAFKPVDLNQKMKNIVSDMEVVIQENNAQIQVEKLPTIDADMIQMRQVFQNLISNAIRYSKEDTSPEITIWSEQKGNIATIYVQDNGIGFNEKYKNRIFNIFERLHGRNQYQGTGVGLAIVKKIIQRHNGTIGVESTEGKGTTFIISLPIHQKGENS